MTSILRRLLFLLFIGYYSANAQTQSILDENFNNNDNNWWVGKEADKEAKLSKGVYQFKNNGTPGNRLPFTLSNLNTKEEDFTIEAKLRLASGKNSEYFGLVFSLSEDGNFYKKFLLKSNGEYSLEECRYGRCMVLTENQNQKAVILGNKFNTLKIVRVANQSSYYINGFLVYRTGLNGFFYNRIAFYTEPKTKIEVDYLKVSKSPIQINLVEEIEFKSKLQKLSSNVNSEYHEMSPIISADGNTMCFVRHGHPQNVGVARDRNDQDIWFSKKGKNGVWSKALNFGKPLNNNGPNAVVSISPDNNSMIVSHCYQDNGSYDRPGLSVTKISGGRWVLPRPLVINEYYNKSQYISNFLCPDNKTLLFSLERNDTKGGRDLYVSFLQAKGDWSAPMNMGKVLNTFGDEGEPYLAADGKTLYFSSDGHAGYGNFDIFVSKRLDDTWTNWSTPQNLGKSINSDGFEMSLYADAKGEYVYLTIDGDIYVAENPKKPDPVVLIQGTVYNKKTGQPMEVEIKRVPTKSSYLPERLMAIWPIKKGFMPFLIL